MNIIKVFSVIAVISVACKFDTNAVEINFGVIDSNKIADSSDAYKKAMETIDQKNEEYAKEAGNIRDTLIAKDKELERQKNVLSPAEYAKKKDSLDVEIQNQEKVFYSKQSSIDKAVRGTYKTFADKAYDVIKNIAKDKNLKIVFNTNNISYYDPSLDVTKDVISDLNKSLQHIPVDVSDPKIVSKKSPLEK